MSEWNRSSRIRSWSYYEVQCYKDARVICLLHIHHCHPYPIQHHLGIKGKVSCTVLPGQVLECHFSLSSRVMYFIICQYYMLFYLCKDSAWLCIHLLCALLCVQLLRNTLSLPLLAVWIPWSSGEKSMLSTISPWSGFPASSSTTLPWVTLC
jgi:hypothetical protein